MIIYIFKILHILCSHIIHIKVCRALKSIKIQKKNSKTIFIKKKQDFQDTYVASLPRLSITDMN